MESRSSYFSRLPVGGVGGGTSLAVRQFFDVAVGRTAVHAPANVFRTAVLVEESAYCLGCLDTRVHDAARDEHGKVMFRWCRCCGRERWA